MDSSIAVPDVTVEIEYARVMRRIGAYLLDFTILLAALLLVSISMRLFRAIGLWAPNPNVDPRAEWLAMSAGSKALVLLAFVVTTGPFYFTLLHASSWQATFGKRLLKLYVTDNSGRRISLPRAFGRWVCLFFSWGTGLLPVSVITAVLSRRGKALHDMVAGTLVLAGQPPVNESLEPWRVFVAFGVPFLWVVATFLFIFGG